MRSTVCSFSVGGIPESESWGAIVVTRRVDNQRVSLPASDRVSFPSRINILRMAAAVEKDRPHSGSVRLVKHHDKLWCLNELIRERASNRRGVCRQTQAARVVLRVVLRSLTEKFSRPRLQRRRGGVWIVDIHPDARKIGLTIRHPRRRAGGHGGAIPELVQHSRIGSSAIVPRFAPHGR